MKHPFSFGKLIFVMIVAAIVPNILIGQSIKMPCNNYHIRNDSVFLYDEYIKYADPKTFTCITGEYGKDKNFVFFSTKRLKKIDLSTFIVLSYGYSKDKNHVYFNYSDEIIPGADPKTFMIYEFAISKDKNAVYYQRTIGKIAAVKHADASTFKEKNGYYYDAKHLYSINMNVLARRDTFDVKDFLEK